PLDRDEVESAKRKMLGQYALGKQTNAQLAQTLGWYECLGLGAEFDAAYPDLIARLAPADLHSVAQMYLRHPVISVVGPQTALDRLKTAQ
ncbi:MAG: insulinase family protein, partial [Cyanobacteria bacterium J06639_1]